MASSISIDIQWNIIQPQKEGNPAICNNMHEPRGNLLILIYAKLNKPITEGQILHGSTYTRYPK